MQMFGATVVEALPHISQYTKFENLLMNYDSRAGRHNVSPVIDEDGN